MLDDELLADDELLFDELDENDDQELLSELVLDTLLLDELLFELDPLLTLVSELVLETLLLELFVLELLELLDDAELWLVCVLDVELVWLLLDEEPATSDDRLLVLDLLWSLRDELDDWLELDDFDEELDDSDFELLELLLDLLDGELLRLEVLDRLWLDDDDETPRELLLE